MSDDRLKAEQLEEIIGLSSLITSSLDPGEIRRRAVEAATRLVDAERASLLRVRSRGNDLYFEIALGDDAEHLKRMRLTKGQGIAGHCIETLKPIIVNDVQSDPHYCGDLDSRTGFTTRSMISVPISCKEEPLGVLQVINKKSGEFDADDLGVVTALANQIAIALENARLYEKLHRSFVETWLYSAAFVVLFVSAGLWLVSLGS